MINNLFRVHKSVTMNRIVSMVERYHTSLDNPGVCFACGADAYSVEPDAREYECQYCGELRVYGAEEALLMLGGI